LAHSNFTYDVLTTIGSPFVKSTEVKCDATSNDLYRYAVKNRMALLYLEALKRQKKLSFLNEEIEKLRERCGRVTDAISKVSQVLRKSDVDYAFFKTIRPYEEVTVDIDVLILGSGYNQAVRTLRRAGYVLLDGDSVSTTFRDINSKLNVDIYNEVNASRLVYLDKVRLERFVFEKRLSNNEVVDCLNPIADLLCIIAHSVIKEQMYVLSEYFTSLYYLSEMDNVDLDEFLGLIKECRLRFTASTHFTVTAFTHYFVHGFFPNKLVKIIDEIGVNRKEFSRVNANRFLMPCKYHMLTFAEALFEKFREKKARRSLAYQALNMLNPGFTSTAIHRLLDHITRETY